MNTSSQPARRAGHAAASASGTAASASGTAAQYRGTAGQSGGTAASASGTAAQYRGTAGQSGGTAAQSGGTVDQSGGTIGPAALDTTPPVAPSLLVRVAMRPMTKVLNPLIGKLAGRRHFAMAAQIHHVGRRSGRLYVTSVGAHVAGETAVIPLTFGNQSDWSKNVRAAGGGSIRVNGGDYDATQPELLDWQDAAPLVRSAFGPVSRAGFRLLGIRQFMILHVEPAAPAPGR